MGDDTNCCPQLLPRAPFWLKEPSSRLDPIWQDPAYMYPSQATPASAIILKILQSKMHVVDPADLMELLNKALEVFTCP